MKAQQELPRLKTHDNRRSSLIMALSNPPLKMIPSIAILPDRNEKFKNLMGFDVEQKLEALKIRQLNLKRMQKARKTSHGQPTSPILRLD